MSPREKVSRAVYSISESSNVRLGLALSACAGVALLVKGSYDLRADVRTDLDALNIGVNTSLAALREEVSDQTRDLRREVQDRYVTKEYIDARLEGTQQVLATRIDGTERVLNARLDTLSAQILSLPQRSDDSRGDGDK